MQKFVALLFPASFAILFVSLFVPLQGRLVGQGPKNAEADKDAAAHTVLTEGEATVRTKPDHARVYLRVETIADTVKEAGQQNMAKVKKVMTAIDGLKIAGLKPTTRAVELKPIHSQEEWQVKFKLPTILGYRCRQAFSVLIQSDDVDKLASTASKVLETALENGANGVEDIEFFRKDLTDLKRDALTKATEDALGNAQALVLGAKRKVTDVLMIDNASSWYDRPISVGGFNMGGFGGGQPGHGGTDYTVFAGTVQVTCKVKLTCLHGPGK